VEAGWQSHAPAALPPGKTRYPLYRRLGESQGRSGRVRKISTPPGFDPRTVQPVASRYTDWAQEAVLKFWRRPKSLAPTGIRTSDSPVRSTVAIPTTLRTKNCLYSYGESNVNSPSSNPHYGHYSDRAITAHWST